MNMRRRWKGLAILATLALVVAAAGYTASALSTTTTLSGGDSVTVNCEGGGRLTQQRLSRTSIRDTCRGATAPSSTTTSSTTTTTKPGAGGGDGGGGGTRACASNPQGNLGPYDYSGIANSNGFNT
jgi:hypothetical protein